MDNTFGERLRELRKRRRMNRDELGDILGVSGNAITAYETGKRNPRKEVIDKICEYFDVRYDWLTGASEYKTDRAFTAESMKKHVMLLYSSEDSDEVNNARLERMHELDLLDAYRELSPRRREQLLEYAEFLAKKKP